MYGLALHKLSIHKETSDISSSQRRGCAKQLLENISIIVNQIFKKKLFCVFF